MFYRTAFLLTCLALFPISAHANAPTIRLAVDAAIYSLTKANGGDRPDGVIRKSSSPVLKSITLNLTTSTTDSGSGTAKLAIGSISAEEARSGSRRVHLVISPKAPHTIPILQKTPIRKPERMPAENGKFRWSAPFITRHHDSSYAAR